MRILTTKQIRELDAYTISHEPIASIDLMERASRAFVEWFTLQIDTSKKAGVVCGTGNNGGDGLAIARLLDEWAYDVVVWIISESSSASEDFKVNRARLPGRVKCIEVTRDEDRIDFSDRDLLIDAIFGSGLSRPPAGLYAKAINLVNESDALRIAVDVPSGLMADAPSAEPIVKADYTVTFQLPKLAFFLPESFSYTGEWVVVDIGLSKEFIKQTDTSYFYIRKSNVRKIRKPRSKFDHKGTFGHALLVAGSQGKVGAAILSARAALRAGVGLLSLHIPGCGYTPLQSAVPEAMCHVDPSETMITTVPDLARYDAVGVGPGLGQDDQTRKAVERLLESGKPAVIDADALNIIATHRHLLHMIPPGSVLTPHPREFERLTGPWKNDFQRLDLQKQLALSLKSVVVLKGAHTSIADERGRVYFNSTGNPGMATGGTGDVLTGVLTALLAQKYTAIEAAITGVFVHGLAGDIAVATYGMDSLIASDVVEHLPQAFLKLSFK